MSDTAKLYAFPLTRRTALVHETVDLCRRKSSPAATRFWMLTVRRLHGELQAAGICPDDIDAELVTFASTVMGMLADPYMDEAG